MNCIIRWLLQKLTDQYLGQASNMSRDVLIEKICMNTEFKLSFTSPSTSKSLEVYDSTTYPFLCDQYNLSITPTSSGQDASGTFEVSWKV